MTVKEDILFETSGRTGVVTLSKPETLNAVTDAMLTALNQQLDHWEADVAIERVLIKAVPGRAFSAGGDIRHLYDRGIAKDYDFDFFAREYVLNARINKFPKPYIALIDGIVMGGGVGVSFHGSHRIAGDNIAFAMPEVGIGFFPDVGASFLLSCLPGKIGLFLGLTGERVKQSDAIWCGLASHGCTSADLPALEKLLCEIQDIEAAIDKYHQRFLLTLEEPGPLERCEHWINNHFDKASVAEIQNSLKQATAFEGDEASWAGKILDILLQKSPTSLEVAFRQITRGRDLDINQCMKMEYRILRRILTGREFYEGIRAAIIDKDRAPKWQPDNLLQVDAKDIEAHFQKLGAQELVLS
ncbi:MAG: enoyl-CoA hydratase/isomerase family protein [Rhizobiaceae bacterium]|nr:enoyl-CoA hydratase/isomerase family protein [Rhizobiaceae bacterium]